ncbi:MAG: hypothetical protein QG608_1182, partial [Actinomycetota bacterium]|nr:hypothetical protein [Actinomycetota bacterium]
MRVLQAIRFTGSLFLLPGLLVALWLFRGVLSSAESGYALAATGRGSGSVILVAPLLAAACAWTGARIRRVRQTYTNSCRSSLVVVLDALWPLIL